jgi:histidinol-phosphate aminotransferase
MYKVCADVNDIEYRPVLLDENFQITSEKLLSACDQNTKIIWICSPNNPTGNLINRNAIEEVLNKFEGIVIIDEAYSDFSSEKPLREELAKHPNMIVLNTMSKAWGCAAIRLGMAFASQEIISLFNKVKYPYNINLLTQKQAIESLKDPVAVEKWVKILLLERSRVMNAFKDLTITEKIYPTDSNFFLVKVTDAQAIYDYLVEKGIIVRNRTRVQLCGNCLRITIGSKSENQELLAALRDLK